MLPHDTAYTLVIVWALARSPSLLLPHLWLKRGLLCSFYLLELPT
ncbi:hypothetical protein [Fischerella sp. PCC 9605]|nr:hypothetical protein [Fischerella sp. PCC 9605]